MDEDLYSGIGVMFTVIVFICGYVYCFVKYGFLLGGSLGWIPSLIVALICGAAWPLLVVILIALASGFIVNQF